MSQTAEPILAEQAADAADPAPSAPTRGHGLSDRARAERKLG